MSVSESQTGRFRHLGRSRILLESHGNRGIRSDTGSGGTKRTSIYHGKDLEGVTERCLF